MHAFDGSHKRYRSRFVPVLLLILVPLTFVSAQTFRGTILGTVTDPNGALVSGARVTRLRQSIP